MIRERSSATVYDASNNAHAVRWDAGVITDLGIGKAYSINDNGVVAGYLRVPAAGAVPESYRAGVWDAANAFTPRGNAARRRAELTAISNSGYTGGWYQVAANNGHHEPLHVAPDGSFTELTSGDNVLDYQVCFDCVNESGIVVGNGINVTLGDPNRGLSLKAFISRAACQDADGDTVCDDLDNCPGVSNLDQSDVDDDNFGDLCDNCPDDTNQNQADADGDGAGDVCDLCQGVVDPAQRDFDGDGVGDACDNCGGTDNPDQADYDTDTVGDACDNCDNAHERRPGQRRRRPLRRRLRRLPGPARGQQQRHRRRRPRRPV
jgi:hypothetical protein